MLSTLPFQSLAQQKAAQLVALKKHLKYLQDHSPYYQKHFDKHSINISKINALEDLYTIPTIGKEEIEENNWAFLCVAKEKIREYTTTSGTLGKPVTIALTAKDQERLAYNEQQSFLTMGVEPTDVVQLMLTLDRQFMAGMAYYTGIGALGAAVVRTGPGLPAMQWETIQRLQTTAIVAVPSFILKLIDYAKNNRIDLNNTSVQKAICIGENLRNENFQINALGEKIKEHWDIALYSTYAATELQTAFTECSHGKGGHEQPDLIITEIVDDNGKPLPPGEYGEITITHLGVEAMPLLRYRTGDIACYYQEPCSCGRHSIRLSPVAGRKKQMIKYKGTTVFPQAVFEVLNKIEAVESYQLEVSNDDVANDLLKIYLHTKNDKNTVTENVCTAMQENIRVKPEIIIIDEQVMNKKLFPENSRKQVKFVDKRK